MSDQPATAAWPDDCLLRACVFTEAGTCTVHGDVCPDCPCGTPLHWEPATAAQRWHDRMQRSRLLAAYREARAAQRPESASAFLERGRRGGKTSESASRLREAIDHGEHAHSLAVGKPTRCWNGDPRCPAWREQGGDLPDSIEVY